MQPKLKAAIWVQAQVRLCDGACLPVAVVRRGDPDAGAIMLKLNRLADGCEVLTQTRTKDGRPAWMRGTGDGPVPEDEADAYIARALDRDPDVWVLEIEDPEDRYAVDGEVI